MALPGGAGWGHSAPPGKAATALCPCSQLGAPASCHMLITVEMAFWGDVQVGLLGSSHCCQEPYLCSPAGAAYQGPLLAMAGDTAPRCPESCPGQQRVWELPGAQAGLRPSQPLAGGATNFIFLA